LFWSDESVKYYPGFKIASVELGLRFGFEVAPRVCFAQNNYTLPFGCHAWPKYDRDFWEPYLLKSAGPASKYTAELPYLFKVRTCYKIRKQFLPKGASYARPWQNPQAIPS